MSVPIPRPDFSHPSSRGAAHRRLPTLSTDRLPTRVTPRARGLVATLLGAVAAALAAVLLGAPAASVSAQEAPQEAEDEVILHLGQIMTSAAETPQGQGLLNIAVAEAEAAARHARFVAEAEELPAMQRHARHVLHALDPNRAPDVNTPGMGYGVIRATEDISTHLTLAREVDEVSAATSENLDAHGPAVVQSAENATRWSRQMIGLVERIRLADSAADAEPLAEELETLGDRVLAGEDLNDDGQIRWQDGEGGILQVQNHMELLMAEMGQ